MADDFPKRVLEAIALLEQIDADYALLDGVDKEIRQRLVMTAGRVSRPGPYAKRELARAARRRHRAARKAADEERLARTGIRAKRAEAVFTTPLFEAPPALPDPTLDDSAEPLHEPRNCYICKRDFSELHHFYDSMCPPCADLNWRKRNQTASLQGRVALVTGSRLKIGYQAAMLLLRAGAHVIVTTRFPRDAATRYAREPDFADWGNRLEIHGLDLRHTPSVEVFCRHIENRHRFLDFIINNACQTVRRPAGFYDHLMQGERADYASLAEPERVLLSSYEEMRQIDLRSDDRRTGLVAAAKAVGLVDPASLSQLALLEEDLERSTHIFPKGQLDADLQQVDLRSINSWRLPMAAVSAVELLEVQLVNAVAPFILNARLRATMARRQTADKHIVNVSAVEGQFYRRFKTDKHPHTNMAKAALNMMTRTSAPDFLQDGIHMNSVDTGWVTDEDPAEIARRKTAEHGFHPPLDIVDGAARIVDPIFDGINTGKHVWGRFLKDYAPTDW